MTDRSIIDVFTAVLENWPAFCVLLATAMLIFGYLLPRAKVPIFWEASPELPRKVLDEYFWTWTPEIARRFLSSIGPNGRRAYRRFYWSMDFWFPTLIASLANLSMLLLAFSREFGLVWLISLAFAGWLFDVLENVNHFRMAAAYPAVSPFSLRLGPLITRTKWIFALAPLVVALIGFALRFR
jgi:hypothetical protein